VKRVFIVTGETGALAEHRDWAVAAFFDEKRATALVSALTQWCSTHRVSPGLLPVNFNRKPPKCPLDPLFKTDDNGTRYYCCMIQVKERKDP
jgi:hypothetical protein